MSDAIEVKISGDALAVLAKLKDTATLRRVIAQEMDFQNDLTLRQITIGHLSGPTTDSSLSVRSGLLRKSARTSKAVPTGTGATSSIGSNVRYAGIHEFGGSIRRVTKPGQVKLRTTADGNLMRQGANGRLAIFAGRRHKRFKSVSYAGGKNYEINIPARAPFGHGIADRADEYGAAVSAAIVSFWGGKSIT